MREFHQDLSSSRLIELLSYCPDSGCFTWRQDRGRKVKAGTAAGSPRGGYVVICIEGISYRAHRLAFLYVTGEWPRNVVDHVNRNRSDNRWVNLREATPSENSQNRGIGVNNTSGFLGVSWKKSERRWQARIKIGGKLKHLGYYDDANVASTAYIEAKARLHPFATRSTN